MDSAAVDRRRVVDEHGIGDEHGAGNVGRGADALDVECAAAAAGFIACGISGKLAVADVQVCIVRADRPAQNAGEIPLEAAVRYEQLTAAWVGDGAAEDAASLVMKSVLVMVSVPSIAIPPPLLEAFLSKRLASMLTVPFA